MNINEYYCDEENEINSNFCKVIFSEEYNSKYFYEIEDDKSNQPTEINSNSLIPNNCSLNGSYQNFFSKEFLTKKKKPSIKNRKYDYDNIRSKIKNNFIRFVFNYLNETIKEKFGHQKLLFRKPEYSDLRNKKKNKEFLQKKLFEFILENDISSKFKTKDPELNKKHLKKFDLNDNSKVSNFLNLTMESIYNNFFLNQKHKKNFDDFIKKLENEEEDKNYIERIKKIAKENFISYYKNYNKKK